MVFLERPLAATNEWWLYGYRTDEVALGPLGWEPLTDGSEFYGMKATNMFRRRVQAVTIPHPILGLVAMRPDTSDHMSLKQGAKKRLVHNRPNPNRRMMRRCRRFIKRKLPEMFRPLQQSDVYTFEEWLERSNYPEWRKQELRECMVRLESGTVQEHKIWEAKMFAKDEFYQEYKYHRTINARSDYIKCIIGRFAASIEKKVFATPWFIKKVPRADWPDYIINRCSGREHGYASDYSSFEASFVKEIMEMCEMQLYEFMLQHVWPKEVNERFQALSGWNNITAKGFFVRLLARRLSGEMVTSLGNGFSNLMINLFVLKEKGARNVTAVVEGDDGLYMFDGPTPTEADFLDLGFVIKLTPVQHLSDASFCGVVFDPGDRCALADPHKTLATCSWLDASYQGASHKRKRDLAVVKGLSMLAQYPGCPVIQSVALWMLRVNKYHPSERDQLLSHALANRTGWWERRVIKMVKKSPFVPVPIGEGSRAVMDRVFKMTPSQQQHIEAIFDNATGAVDLSDVEFLNSEHKYHWRRYTCRGEFTATESLWPWFIKPEHDLEGEDRWAHHVPHTLPRVFLR